MKSLKKTLVLLVVLSMLLSAISPVFAAKFNDEIPESFEEYANKLAAIGVIAGDQNGNFNATSNITRAETAVIICKMVGIDEVAANASKSVPSVFSDVPANEWYTGWINLAVNNGMISGFPDGTFRPNDSLTVNQAITLVVKALGKGAYVDKMGTWPGNYVQEAAKLGITRKLVATDSDLAIRGNVAILVWEALQVGTWDVIETSLESGEVTLSVSDPLIIKFFKDFVAGKGTNNDRYRVKLVEDAVVVRTGRTTTEIGEDQVTLRVEVGKTTFNGERTVQGSTIARHIDAQNKPKKGAKEATYAGEGNDDVVAYVPEDVADIEGLVGKKVTVLFGKDNEVALLYVTEESVNDAYVTYWDNATGKITVADVDYKVKDDTTVSVFNYELVAEGKAPITAVIEALGVEDPTKEFNRVLKADITLDAKDKVETINFTFSEEVPANNNPLNIGNDRVVEVEQGVVKQVTKDGVIRRLNGPAFFGGDKVEDLDEDDETRVIRDGKVATFADIAEGDVITAIKIAEEYPLVYVSSDRLETKTDKVEAGRRVKTDDGDYTVVILPVVNTDGEFDDAAATAEYAKDVSYTDAELYLTFLGEIAGIICDGGNTGLTFGIVTGDSSYAEDEEDVTYLKVKILTDDGTANVYKVYNKKSGDDIGTAKITEDRPGHVAAVADQENFRENMFEQGDLVVFQASDKKIKSNKIWRVLDGVEYDLASNKDVVAIEAKAVEADEGDPDDPDDDVAAIAAPAGDEDKKTITYNGTRYNWKDASSVAFASINEDGKTEKIASGWKSIIVDDAFADGMDNVWLFVKGSKIIYFVAEFEEGYQTSDLMFGMRTNSPETTAKDSDDTVFEISLYNVIKEGTEYVARTLTNFIEEEDDDDAAKYDFVSFKVSGDYVEQITTLITDAKKFDELKNGRTVNGIVANTVMFGEGVELQLANVVKAQFVVDEAEFDGKGGSITYVDDAVDDNDAPKPTLGTVDLDEDVVVFDLSDPTKPTSIDPTDLESELTGNSRYALCFKKAAADTEASVVVIF